jgi:carboxymethylenebutenolidase
MFKYLFIIVLCTFLFSQEKATCCNISSNSLMQFASFSADKSFMNKHLEPLPWGDKKHLGEMKEIPISGEKSARFYELKSKKKSANYLFVFQEWWGLNDYIKNESDIFYSELKDVNVIAIDLYDGNVATSRDSAGAYMQRADPERISNIIKSVINYCGSDAKITTVGWCFGGGWSLQASLLAGANAVGCVMYYGMPEKDLEKLKTLNCDVLGIFAAQEKWISPEVVKQFQADMKQLNKTITVENYEAEHAFANPSNPKFNEKFAKDAHNKALKFISGKLK